MKVESNIDILETGTCFNDGGQGEVIALIEGEDIALIAWQLYLPLGF